MPKIGVICMLAVIICLSNKKLGIVQRILKDLVYVSELYENK